MKLPRWILLGTVYLGELLLILCVVLFALRVRAIATPSTADAFLLAATTPIHGPTLPPQGTTKPTGLALANTIYVGKNAPANLENKFLITYVGEFRDRVLFAPSQVNWKYAKGIYATIQFRIKNLQPVNDSLALNYDLLALTEDGQKITSDQAAQANAVWEYCQCDTDRRSIPPGGESVFVITFDVPVATQQLIIAPAQQSSDELLNGDPHFIVANFDKVHAWR